MLAEAPRRSGSRRDRPPQLISVRLRSATDAARVARDALGRLEPDFDGRLLDDLRLLVSELVTNSLRHSEMEAAETVGLEVSASPSLLRVEVSDAGIGFERRAPTPDQEHGGGWGLYLVETIADRWGVVRGERTRVWFEIDCPTRQD
jgi:anti-sigma regulatory factor (Ser/Thr protein kinase)